ncbi:MaoC family dehydratase [Microbacterium soli]|uniref:MaoC-like domain-containing protein n=1 Tax=Microbacterium soli TaxID=446075 RepID=A0ABP7MZC7_9MICO
MWHDIEVGDELPSSSRTTDLENWNRFAAVNDEFVPIHMDDAAGIAAGYPSAIGMGNLQVAYLHNLIRDWLGAEGEIKSISTRFEAPNLRGQTITARGVVTAINAETDRAVISLDVWTENDDGEVLAPSRAVVVMPSEAHSEGLM